MPYVAIARVGNDLDTPIGELRIGHGREADPAMNRLLAAALSAATGAALAFAAAFGVLALINATPDQPNTPLVTYETPGQGG